MRTQDSDNITIGGYACVERLTDGALGYRFASQLDEQAVHVECLSLRHEDELFTRFCRRIELMTKLRHRHLVPLLDAGLDGDTLYIVTPQPQRSDDASPTLSTVITAAAGMASGLAELHRNGVLHRNLQPCHVGWFDGVVKLGGVGLADISSADRTNGIGPIGGVVTMAPSIVAGRSATEGSDVYSMGATLHLLATGEAVHPHQDAESLARRIIRMSSDPPTISRNLIPEVRSIVETALAQDGRSGSSALELVVARIAAAQTLLHTPTRTKDHSCPH